MRPPVRKAALAAVVAGLAACVVSLGPAKVEHLVQRLGYGAAAGEVAEVEALGRGLYVATQLAPAAIDDSALDAILAQYPTLSMSIPELLAAYGPNSDDPTAPRREMRAAFLLGAVLSARQLEGVLTDFWFNHLNVDGSDGLPQVATGPYVRDAIRPHVLGRFEDLLVATAKHPAMLDYLDNAVSFAEGFVFHGHVFGLNENYARELMELHTLGVNGGYTQDDVIAVARAFTGWTIDRTWQNPDGFLFLAQGHDTAPKTISVLDLSLPGNGGLAEGETVLHELAIHPATAARLCRKLAMRLVSEAPPQDLVDECTATWLATGGDLHDATYTLVMSEHFAGDQEVTPEFFRSKVARPTVFLAKMLRTVGADPTLLTQQSTTVLVRQLEAMGESLYQTAPPTGLPESSGYWAGAGPLLTRWNLAHTFTQQAEALGVDWGVPAGAASGEIVDTLAARLVPGGLGGATRDQVVAFVDGLGNAPDDVLVEEAAAMILATPEFLSH